MIKVRESRSPNPDRGPRVFDDESYPAERFPNYEGWELRKGACAKLTIGEATICVPPCVAARARRFFAQCVLTGEAPHHVDPAA